ncbi:ATP-binding cassette domain-containing protein [Bacillus sp. D-CC]
MKNMGFHFQLIEQEQSAKKEEKKKEEAKEHKPPVTEGEARHILAKFLFYGPAVFKKVTQLSGGEKMRLRLAQLMYQDINFLILDEPTNHLDIESREVLEEALEQYNGTILAVSLLFLPWRCCFITCVSSFSSHF